MFIQWSLVYSFASIRSIFSEKTFCQILDGFLCDQLGFQIVSINKTVVYRIIQQTFIACFVVNLSVVWGNTNIKALFPIRSSYSIKACTETFRSVPNKQDFLKEYPMNNYDKFNFNWPSGFRAEDWNESNLQTITGAKL